MRIDAPARPRRRANFTPMIDVVFLLLIFFMMISRFGALEAVPLTMAGGGGVWNGPPRVVDIGVQGLRLNGQPVADGALAAALAPLMASPDDPVILRPDPALGVQGLVAVMQDLRAAGLRRLVLVN